MSPMQHLKYLRIQQAEQLLRDTFLSVKEIAFRCGAKDLSHFVRDFKRRKGLTPTAFRSQCEMSSGFQSRAQDVCE
jgi:transcriptional regulator GlxA family with amidase domain